jgi:hypothetical protein
MGKGQIARMVRPRNFHRGKLDGCFQEANLTEVDELEYGDASHLLHPGRHILGRLLGLQPSVSGRVYQSSIGLHPVPRGCDRPEHSGYESVEGASQAMIWLEEDLIWPLQTMESAATIEVLRSRI